MKPITVMVVLSICLCAVSCSSVYSPKYVAEMMVSRQDVTGSGIISEGDLLVSTESYEDDTSLVDDDLVQINAALTYRRIWIGLINKTDQPLEVLWSEAVVIHRGVSEPLLLSYPRTETKKGGPGWVEVLKPIQIIEPNSNISEGIFPKSLRYSEEHEFFGIRLTREQSRKERKETVAEAVGQKVEVMIPLMTPMGSRNYTIRLTVHSAEVQKYTHYIM